MTAYTFTHRTTTSHAVAARKAARRKVIEAARKLERESYKAWVRKNTDCKQVGKIV